MSTAPAFASGGASVPRHVAIIMDGNGRWAKKRLLPRAAGHKAGVEAVRRVTRHARAIGIEALTLYAFSSENWRRPEEEIGDLMGLLRLFIRSDLAELVRGTHPGRTSDEEITMFKSAGTALEDLAAARLAMG